MKHNKMLTGFLATLLTAVLLGIVAGRYVAASGVYITLTPFSYMRGLVYVSPRFMIVAVVGLVVYIAGRGRYPKLPAILSVYVYTVTGIIVSGFCGLYTMDNFVFAAAGVVAGVLVLLCLVVAGKQTQPRIRIATDHSRLALSKVGFGVYGAVVILSAFIPIGPLPVIIIGILGISAIFIK